jgi:hypothetical protein
MKKLIILITLTFLSSCATSHFKKGEIFDTVNITPYKVANYNLGEKISGTLGRPFAVVNIGWSYDAYEVVNSFKPEKLYGNIDIPELKAGDKLKVHSKYKSDGKESLLLEHNSFHFSGIPHYLSITDNGNIANGWIHKDGTAIDTTQVWEKGRYFKKADIGFPIENDVKKFEIIYKGKIGTIVKFTFKEYENNKPIPISSEDISYDLTESTDFAYKKFKGKIVEASNTEVVVVIHEDPYPNKN